MASPQRIAVVGLGTMAQSVHLPMIQRRHDRFQIAAVVDISTRRRTEASAKWRIPEESRYESVADLMKAVRHKEIEIDGVVFSADGVKAEDLLLIIKRGIPVLVEPPVGYGIDEVEQIAGFERMAGRTLTMIAYPSLFDTSVRRFKADTQMRDLRILEFETLMPASGVMFGKHHVTAAAYDLPTEVRAERREKLSKAVLDGAGHGTIQRDRDLYVKGLLTGLVEQLATLRSLYGAMDELHGVRHWPEQVIPGSLEVLGAYSKGPHVRIAWHYLPFASELHDSIRFVTTRKQGRVALPGVADLEARGTYTFTHKTDGAVTTVSKRSDSSSAYSMYEAFFEFLTKGTAPVYGVAEALEDIEIARAILSDIAMIDGRDINAVEEEPVEAESPKAEVSEAEESSQEQGPTGAVERGSVGSAQQEPEVEGPTGAVVPEPEGSAGQEPEAEGVAPIEAAQPADEAANR